MHINVYNNNLQKEHELERARRGKWKGLKEEREKRNDVIKFNLKNLKEIINKMVREQKPEAHKHIKTLNDLSLD